MPATKQYFAMVMFMMLYKLVLTLEFMDEILSVTIQVKATEQYFIVMLFVFHYSFVGALQASWSILGELLKMKGLNYHFWNHLTI